MVLDGGTVSVEVSVVEEGISHELFTLPDPHDVDVPHPDEGVVGVCCVSRQLYSAY